MQFSVYYSIQLNNMKHLFKTGLLALALAGFNTTANAQHSELTFYTTMGNITIQLADSLVPRTVDSFQVRVAKKFYDGLIFHRVINNFMIQGGDPMGNGMGGPGYSTPDEYHPTLKNKRGSLAMANSGPNTNGSQFYINLVDNAFLDGHYVVLGMTTAGFPVVQSIGNVQTANGDRPVSDVKMDSVRITKFPWVLHDIKADEVHISAHTNNGMFTVDVPKTSTKVEAFNMSGQSVFSAEGKRSVKVDISKQPVGLYIVRLSNQQGTTESRIVKQ
jgi:peptidyl-prolyl cis-trans isomerase A (cyclophilin A)